MIIELIRAFLLIFAAEMGDKTQIIAMTFATQYRVKEVLIGVFIGVFFNHGLAIVMGRYLSKLVPMDYIQLVAGLMFVVFGFLALTPEDLEQDGSKKSFGPILTVALAFFIGELGDKTQLTAMSLSAEGNYPFFILLGTTLGMIGTSGVGILVGSKIGGKIPDTSIKVVSSLIFLLFGTLKLYQWVPIELLSFNYVIIYLILIIAIESILIMRLVIRKRDEISSPMKEVAATLYIQTRILNDAIEDICLGEGKCGNCSGGNCIIGYTKLILKNAREKDEYYIKDNIDIDRLINKDFDKYKVLEALSLIIVDYMRHGLIEDEKFIINQVKKSLETILLGKEIKFKGNLSKYIRNFKKENDYLGKILEEKINLKYKNSI